MNIENCKRNPKGHNNAIQISFRISTQLSTWLKEQNLSPRGIFLEACKELNKKD